MNSYITESLRVNGMVMIPFTIVNNSYLDLLKFYIKPVIDYSIFTELRRIPNVEKHSSISTRLNVFTKSTYKEFLQMVSREDVTVGPYRYTTLEIVDMLNSDAVKISNLPQFSNCDADYERFDSIQDTAYSQFSKDKIHFIKTVTKAENLNKAEKVCEYNLFIPQFVSS